MRRAKNCSMHSQWYDDYVHVYKKEFYAPGYLYDCAKKVDAGNWIELRDSGFIQSGKKIIAM